MLLFELFKTEVGDREVVTDNSHKYEVHATIGDRKIVFLANEYTFHDNEWWDVEFAQEDEGELSYNLTKGGKEFEVFSFILQCMKEFIQNHHPKKIKFSADKKEGEGRANLYGKLAKKLLSGYEVERNDKGAQIRFTLEKK